jgi:hypothetical protein
VGWNDMECSSSHGKVILNLLFPSVSIQFPFTRQLRELDYLDDVVLARYNQMGCHTYRFHNPFNRHMISTASPHNIQAMLATKFHDFNVGPYRRNSFHRQWHLHSRR